MTDHKEKIISELDVLRKISATETAGVFKARQYAAAIKTLKALPHVRSVADLPLSTKGDGLGEKIREKIARIIETGGLVISDAARDQALSLEAFQKIYGVGPKKAMDLVAAGYKTIAELRATAGSKLFNKNQLIGLQYYEALQERIPRAEMDGHAALLMAAKPATLDGVIVGSYRRGRPDSGDIDMLLTGSGSLTAFVEALQAQGYIREILAHGDHKCMAIASLPLPSGTPRRLDLLITPPEEFPFAVLYFTGSDGFNVKMRSHALTRGYTLNEHGIARLTSGRAVHGIRTERDIFALLKMVWREPHERTGPEAFALSPLLPLLP
jgi:DNA polymerase/3'-5' exonuclease PolX